MSTTSRLISGSAASWMQIVVTITFQLLLVPIYLTYWDVHMYGMWLAVQAIFNLINTFDTGHQYYLYFEFLKIDQKDKDKISMMLCSGIRMLIASGFIQLLVVIACFLFGNLNILFGEKGTAYDNSLLNQAGIVLILQCISWLLGNSISGLLQRAAALYGYYSNLAWKGVFYTVVTTLAPTIAVMLGAKLILTGIVFALAKILFNIPILIYMVKLLKKEYITFNKASWKIGFGNFVKSFAVTGKDILETIRQQGVRIVLIPLVGVTELAFFATMRTGANMFLQGLNTITNPLLPELMRFLNQRDQEKSEAGFGTVWIVLVAVIAPIILIIQAFIGPLFSAWTRGHIPFDPALFAMLSFNILVYGIGQPAIAVVTGNNLLRYQLIISIIAGVLLIGFMFLLVPHFGLRGAAISLIIAESSSTIGYQLAAKKWLVSHDLMWPNKPFFIAVLSLCITAVGMLVMILLPKFFVISLIISLGAIFWNALRYWRVLPKIATDSALKIFFKLPGLKKIFKVNLL